MFCTWASRKGRYYKWPYSIKNVIGFFNQSSENYCWNQSKKYTPLIPWNIWVVDLLLHGLWTLSWTHWNVLFIVFFITSVLRWTWNISEEKWQHVFYFRNKFHVFIAKVSFRQKNYSFRQKRITFHLKIYIPWFGFVKINSLALNTLCIFKFEK